MPRFVLLYHDCSPGFLRPSHWDLMLESGGALRTWALAELPSAWQTGDSRETGRSEAIEAERLPDHRLAYLDYEGPVSGERGTVRCVEAGTYETLVDAADRCEVMLAGVAWRGRISLCRKSAEIWLLTVESRD